MKQIQSLFFFILLLGKLSIGYSQISTIENLFSQFLLTEDKKIANSIINKNDGLYSLFCKAGLTNDLAEKINLYSKFIAQSPNLGLAKAYLYRGTAFSLSKMSDSALVDFNKSIEIDPKDAYAYYFRGESQLSLEDYEKAIEDFNQAIKMNSNFILAYQLRSLSYFYLKQNELALKDINKALALNSKNDQAYIIRGIIYEEEAKYNLAIDDWKKAKSLNKTLSKHLDGLIKEASKKIKQP